MRVVPTQNRLEVLALTKWLNETKRDARIVPCLIAFRMGAAKWLKETKRDARCVACVGFTFMSKAQWLKETKRDARTSRNRKSRTNRLVKRLNET